MKMFMSPSIKRTFNQLTISVIEARDLPTYGNWLSSASLECYMYTEYGGGNPLKTDVHEMVDTSVHVKQTFLIPVQTPVVADRLVIDTYDHNTMAYHSHIGSLILSVKQLLAEGTQPGGFYTWCSLYGSPADNTGAEADAMNQNPEIASKWKGMVLLHIEA